ncbi:MAG: acyl carrier protein [Tissierellia bacterium]|jgi:acyl carrier protein|nr:acyl carrier protein [Bacillota bacterium]NLL22269.1 acyl carrier protein [Tissierellia bacterium]
MNIFETVVSVIAEQMSVDPATITRETDLQGDLGADSIDAAEMILNIEDLLDIRISDEALTNIKTVDDILKFLGSTIEED